MKKKILALCLIIALAATAVISGTLAYFSDNDYVENTFTIGKVGLDVTESKGNETAGEGDDHDGFNYENMMPGVTYAKNVDVDMDEDSRDAFVFVELEFTNVNELVQAIQSAFPGKLTAAAQVADYLLVNPNPRIKEDNMVAYKWSDNGETCSFVYYFGVRKAEDHMDIFNGIQLPKELDETHVKNLMDDGFKLTVKAHAIQAEGVDLELAKTELLYNKGYTKPNPAVAG